MPVVMKVSAVGLQHKSELGLVRLGVSTLDDVSTTFENLHADAVAAGVMDVEGVLVCGTVRGGVETIVGIAPDPVFGPTVMFGLGGVFTEVLGDVSFRVPPFDRREARRMIGELQGHAVLAGARSAAVDIESIVDAIMAVQRMAADLGDSLSELDINPLVAMPQGAVALDALAIGRRRASPSEPTGAHG
jgi:hypothetical protein